MLVRYCTADALKNHERANAFNPVFHFAGISLFNLINRFAMLFLVACWVFFELSKRTLHALINFFAFVLFHIFIAGCSGKM